VGSFPKTSEQLGCASEGRDLPAGPLEGVLRLRRGTHLHFDMRGGAIIKISAAERRNLVLGQLTIFGVAISVATLADTLADKLKCQR
jgi:hypothetical protein